jgi:hypothetical protein
MAITATERTQIIELVTLMFNAAPGATYLSDIVSVYEANGHNLQALAETLGQTGIYQSLNPNFQTAAEFASSFLTPLGLQGDAFATDFIVSRFNSGVSKADIEYQAFQALNGVTSSSPSQYVNAKAILMNKEAVAEYYSVATGGSATDLSTLQNVLSGVTADASTVTAAENVINGTAGGGQTFNLTTNIDNLTGTSGNDTFVGSIDAASSPNVVTLNALDTINGGGGVNSLMVNVAGDTSISVGAGMVTNVQNLTINSTDNALESSIYLNDNGFTNLTMVNPYDTSVYGINEGASVTQQGTAVAGGNNGEVYSEYFFDPTTATTVNMNDTVTGAGTNFYNEAYFYHGDGSADGNLANATTINANLTGSNANIVNSDGEVDAYQYIYADNAGNAGATITVNLTASNNQSQDGSTYSDVETYVYQTGDAHVTANINVSNSADIWTEVDAQEDSSPTAKAANNTANVTLNNVSGTAGDTGVGAYGFDTVNVNVTGAAQLDDGLFFDEYHSTATDANSQTLTITAGADLTSAATRLDYSGTTKTVVTGSGNVDLGAYYGSSSSTLSSTGTVITSMIDASALTGGFKVDAKDPINSILGGSGNDTIYVENVSTAGVAAMGGLTLDGGAGTDTLGLNVADWATISGLSAANLGKITNFEVLALHGALTTGTYDPSLISGVTSFSALSGVATGNTASVVNLGANATVTLAGDLVTNNGNLALAMKTDTTADTLNLVLKPSGSTIVDNNDTAADNHIVSETIDASNIETLNITSTGKISAPTSPVASYKADYITNALSLTDNALKSLVISGDTSLAFTAAASQTALTSVDASANTAKHGVSIDMHLDTKAVTMLGSTGNDTLIGTVKADTINGLAGNDSITGGAGADTLTGGAGNDQFVYAAATDSTLLNLDTITDFSANTWGQGVDATTSQPDGSATSAGANPASSKINGDLINLHAVDTTFSDTAIKVSVQANAADAQTFLQNMAADASFATTTGVALDSSSGRVYIDFNHDGTVDSVIQLTGVTTLTSSAFVV